MDKNRTGVPYTKKAAVYRCGLVGLENLAATMSAFFLRALP
jgi:hypothetical protein